VTRYSCDNAYRPKIDTTVAHSARVWNYWLGGKDNHPADRAVGDQIMAMIPGIARLARLQRAFLACAVQYLARDAGIRQFLDIGTGLPTADNTHEVAQRVRPDARIVYVDNDPLVLVHAEALLTSSSEGTCDYVEADLRDPGKILAEAARTLDFGEPIAVMLLGIVGQIPDSDHPEAIVAKLLDAVPSGSYLAISDGVSGNETMNEAAERSGWYHVRSPEQVAGFCAGLEQVDAADVTQGADLTGPDEVPWLWQVGRKP
jgi:hypothetical protein